MCAWSHFSCVQICYLMGCSPPGSSVCGILQARTLEWIVISSSSGSSWTRDETQISYVSCIGRQVLYHKCLLGSFHQPDFQCHQLAHLFPSLTWILTVIWAASESNKHIRCHSLACLASAQGINFQGREGPPAIFEVLSCPPSLTSHLSWSQLQYLSPLPPWREGRACWAGLVWSPALVGKCKSVTVRSGCHWTVGGTEMRLKVAGQTWGSIPLLTLIIPPSPSLIQWALWEHVPHFYSTNIWVHAMSQALFQLGGIHVSHASLSLQILVLTSGVHEYIIHIYIPIIYI